MRDDAVDYTGRRACAILVLAGLAVYCTHACWSWRSSLTALASRTSRAGAKECSRNTVTLLALRFSAICVPACLRDID
jgi:hypothetical protein